MTFVSYAQNFEDVLLWRALGDVARGFYIDVGAAHPDVESVTRAFYERGWSGINVEPVAASITRLRAARPRDINLDAAVGERAGHADFFEVEGTGLSTLRRDVTAGYDAEGFAVVRRTVAVRTLADICRAHAHGPIHFLKIDVEGAEREVLAGADFAAFRPWIVLVEATAPMSVEQTHSEWEALLTESGYAFAWFDGLNRYYVAREHAALAPLLAAPPSVFDDFLRAADTDWARRINQAETEARALHDRVRASESRERAQVEELGRANRLIDARGREIERLRGLIALAEQRHVQDELRAHELATWLASTRSSTSWKVTAPLRQAGAAVALIRRRAPQPAAPAAAAPVAVQTPLPEPEPEPDEAAVPAPAVTQAPSRLVRTVHQFHSGSAAGDAITNAMLLTRDALRAQGYASDIFVQHRDPALEGALRPMDELPEHADYVLIVRHSMGHDALAKILSLPPRKVLIYHNITPPALLGHAPDMQRYAALGRRQLAQLPQAMSAALADSDYSALELRASGFEDARACALLFDTEALLARAASRPARTDPVFTVLFVGRVIASKGQDALIDAFAAFARRREQPARLVLVGRDDPGSYGAGLRDRIAALGLGDRVIFTGLISDRELDGWYGAADLYVSLSLHEGFGVPLVEAMAHGVPVLAWPSGAVGYTLPDPPLLLPSREPEAVADAMLALARDPARRQATAVRQRGLLDRFALDRQLPRLTEALARAGAAPPIDRQARASIAGALRWAITGHVRGSYSLAAINRRLAIALEAARPGSVRLLPVEGDPVRDLSGLPPGIATLARRPAPDSGPEIVVSQHYPVHVPAERGDAVLAYFFWEESVVPETTVASLNGFAGVLAPSASVAKALIDSGVHVPVRIVGLAPALDAHLALRAVRAARPDRPFTFLHVSSCFPRKGVDALLAAWVRAFRDGDRVQLVIKGFPNPHNDVAARIGRLGPGAAPITLIDEDCDDDALLALYRDADAMVLPTRGEGFNIPAAEALAAGIPLIVTGHGGHMDFCGRDPGGLARLVNYRFAPSGSHVASGGSVWADPDVDDLAAALRDAAAGRVPPCPEPAARALGDAAPWIARLAEAATGILLAPKPRPLRLGVVTTWDLRCGIATYSRHLLDALPDQPVTVYADQRTAASAGGRVTVRPVWRVGDAATMPDLALAIARDDPDALVIEHQPGLIGWGALATLLGSQSVSARVAAVTLHSTRDLNRVDEAERGAALAALSRVARVVVHSVADLNFLQSYGLTSNVTLIPHGAAPAQPARAARALERHAFPLIGCYGFFLPDKGIRQLIEAVALLRADWPSLRLRLVNADYGSEESAREIAAARLAAAGLDDAVEWHTDFLPEDSSRALLAACDLIVLPYQRSQESASGALHTAMEAGVAVAVTPQPIFDEAGGAVLRTGGGDAATIARDVSLMLADRDARAGAQKAAARFLDERAWTRVAPRLRDMLRGLLA